MSSTFFRTTTRLAILSAGAILSIASFGPGDEIPESDLCVGGVSSGATSVVIGGESEASFSPLAADDIVQFLTGGQGADMLLLSYRVTGTEADCIEVATRVFRCDPAGISCTSPDATPEQIVDSTRSLAAYPDGDGRITRTDYVILDGDGGSRNRSIEVNVAGATQTLEVWVDEVGTAPQDAGPGGIDAGTDAAIDAGRDASADAM